MSRVDTSSNDFIHITMMVTSVDLVTFFGSSRKIHLNDLRSGQMFSIHPFPGPLLVFVI